MTTMASRKNPLELVIALNGSVDQILFVRIIRPGDVMLCSQS